MEGHTDIARFLLASGSVVYERNNVSARVHVYWCRSPIVVVRVNFSMPEDMCVCVCGSAGVLGMSSTFLS